MGREKHVDDLRCRECLVLTLGYCDLLFLFISNEKYPELCFAGTGGRAERGALFRFLGPKSEVEGQRLRLEHLE